MADLDKRERASNTAVLEVTDLTTSFGPKNASIPVVKGVSFEVGEGKTLALLGESGSGKSVTSRSVLGLHRAGAHVGGSVRVSGIEIVGATERDLRPHRGTAMGFVPQDPNGSLDPLRRVRRQLHDVLSPRGSRLRRGDALATALSLLDMVGIRDPERVVDAYPHELSGGMKQRVAIAMAVCREPSLLVADEPTTALDPTVQKQILDLFSGLQERLGMAMIFVTHDVDVARTIADDVAVMHRGVFVEHGPAREVLTEPSHPYTRALLAAIPRTGSQRGRLPTVAESLAAEGIDPTDWILS